MQEKIIEFISNYQGIDKNGINGNTNLVTDLGMASMDIMEMCCQIEDETGIEIMIEDIFDLRTINDVVNYIENEMNVQASET